MIIISECLFNGGILIVMDVFVIKCGCEEEVFFVDSVLMVGYVRMLIMYNIVGNVIVFLNEIVKNFLF